MEHKETYKHIASLMGHKSCGEQICKKLVRAMTEEISPPFGSNHDDSEGDFDDAGMQDVEVDDNNMDFSNLEDDEASNENDEPCPDCDGQGIDENGQECQSCQGTGFINELDGDEEMNDDMNGDMGDDDMGDMNAPDQNFNSQSPSMQNFQRAMMSRR